MIPNRPRRFRPSLVHVTLLLYSAQMADIFSPRQRSALMSRVKWRDTKPEILVRKYLHSRGFRFRLHRRDLPGKPDLVFPSRRKVVFVHGCFWHVHTGCSRASLPNTRREFWSKKLMGNKARDKLVRRRLARMGWRSYVIWECQLRKNTNALTRVSAFLDS